MCESGTGALGVVYGQGTNMVVLEFASHDGSGNFAFLDVGEHVDIEEEPVGQHHQAFNAAVEEHFEITLKTAAFVMHIGENGQKRRLVKCIFHAAQHERAVGGGHVGDH